MLLYPCGIHHHVINIRVSPGRTCSLLSESAVSLNTSIQPVHESKEHGTKTLKSFSQLLMVCNWQTNPASCFFDSFIVSQLNVVLVTQVLLCLLESLYLLPPPPCLISPTHGHGQNTLYINGHSFVLKPLSPGLLMATPPPKKNQKMNWNNWKGVRIY